MLSSSPVLPQVVQRIKAIEAETQLLVVDKETDEHFRSLRLTCSEEAGRPVMVANPEAPPVKGPHSSNGDSWKALAELSSRSLKRHKHSLGSESGKKVRLAGCSRDGGSGKGFLCHRLQSLAGVQARPRGLEGPQKRPVFSILDATMCIWRRDPRGWAGPSLAWPSLRVVQGSLCRSLQVALSLPQINIWAAAPFRALNLHVAGLAFPCWAIGHWRNLAVVKGLNISFCSWQFLISPNLSNSVFLR